MSEPSDKSNSSPAAAGDSMSGASSTSTPSHGNSGGGIFGPTSWVPYVMPLVVYLLANSLVPSPPAAHDERALAAAAAKAEREAAARGQADQPDASKLDRTERTSVFSLEYDNYPVLYTVKIVLTLLAVLLAIPCYRHFPLRWSWLAVAVGAFGVFLWVGLCRLDWESKLLGPVGLGWLVEAGERPAFNPFEHFADQSPWLWAFLAMRFAGLVLIVPVIEEFFYRGFLMRVVIDETWWRVPIGQASRLAVLAGTFFPALAHPSELLAAIAWFGMVTWLVLKTRNIWDCVIAHAITNLLLGVYVVSQGEWQLW